MTTEAQLQKMVQVIQSDLQLRGCRVVHAENGRLRTLHRGYSPSIHYLRVVILEEGHTSAASSHTPGTLDAPPSAAPTSAVSNRSKILPELLGLGLSTGFCVVSWLGVAAGAAAEVPTLGGSTMIAALGYVGVATSSLQCSNALMRVLEIYRHPNEDTLEYLDHIDDYGNAILAVDAAGILCGAASFTITSRHLAGILARRGGMKTVEELKAMQVGARKEEVKAALARATRTREGRKEVEEALLKAGVVKQEQLAKLFKHGLDSRVKSGQIAAVLSATTARRLSVALRDRRGYIGSVTASGSPATIVGSASGSVNASVNWIIVHVFDALPSENMRQPPP